MTPADRRPARIAVSAVCALLTTGGVFAAQGAAAGAATLIADHGCYVNVNPAAGAPMVLTGSGYTPGDTVDITGGTVFATAPVDANGNFVTAPTAAPILNTIGPASKTTTLVATSESSGEAVATTVVHSANLSFSVSPQSVPYSRFSKQKVTFSFSGFTPNKHIYGFYMRNGKTVAKDKFKKAGGACGMLKQRALLFPGGHPKKVTYKVAFESSSRYVKKAFPQIDGQLKPQAF